MKCTHCGTRLESVDLYCCECGQRAGRIYANWKRALLPGIVFLSVIVWIASKHTAAPPTAPPSDWSLVRPPLEVSALVLQGDVIWAGGRDGLVAIDRKTARLREVPPGQPEFRYISDLLLDRRGNLWIAHLEGVTKYAGGAWQNFSAAAGFLPGQCNALCEDDTGSLWIGYETGLVRYDGRTAEVFAAGQVPGLSSVNVIYQDRSLTMWFGSSSPTHGSLRSYDGKTWRAYSTRDGLAHNSVNDILQDRSGALWFATGYAARGGAIRLSQGRWITWTNRDGLAGEKVRSLFEDRDGSLWFGSEFNGLAFYNGKGWGLITPKDGLAGWEARKILQDNDGAIWIGTENGVSRIPALEVSPSVAGTDGKPQTHQQP